MSVDEGSKLARRDHLLLVLAVIGVRFLVVPSCPTYDDAFITYRYAQNCADGRGLVFNPGEAWEPILGITTPLYALLMTIAAWLGLGLVSASLYANVLFDACTALLLPKLFAHDRSRSILALAAFIALPALVRITVGGMEPPLFALLGLAAVVAFSSRRPWLAGLATAGACLVRPEGVLVGGVLFLAGLRRPRELVRFVAPVAIVGIASVVWLTSVYGSPIPQSVTAKATVRAGSTWDGSVAVWGSILQNSFVPHGATWVLVPLVLYGLARALRESGPLRLFSLWALAITASYLIARPHMWGWYYFVPLVAWTCWLGVGSAALAGFVARRTSPGLVRFASSSAVSVVFLFVLGAAWYAGTSHRTPVNERVYRPMSEWAMRTSGAEPKARILASDIGAIGWWWRGTVLDSAGLVWPAALEFESPNAMIEREKPEYVLLVAERFRVRQFRSRADLYALYEPVARFSASGRTDLEPALEDVEILWTQDYIAFKRRAP